MQVSYWYRMFYLPLILQWMLGFAGLFIVAGSIVNFSLMPRYRALQAETEILTQRRVEVSTLITQYQQYQPQSSLQHQSTFVNDVNNNALTQMVLSGNYAITRWQQNEKFQQVILLLEWQQFLDFFSQMQALTVVQVPSTLRLHAQGAKIAVQITINSTQE